MKRRFVPAFDRCGGRLAPSGGLPAAAVYPDAAYPVAVWPEAVWPRPR